MPFFTQVPQVHLDALCASCCCGAEWTALPHVGSRAPAASLQMLLLLPSCSLGRAVLQAQNCYVSALGLGGHLNNAYLNAGRSDLSALLLSRSYLEQWPLENLQISVAIRVVHIVAARQARKQCKDSLRTDLRMGSICVQWQETITKHIFLCLYKLPHKVTQSGHVLEETLWKLVLSAKGPPASLSQFHLSLNS